MSEYWRQAVERAKRSAMEEKEKQQQGKRKEREGKEEKEEKDEGRPRRERKKPERLTFSASSSSSPLVVSGSPPSDFPVPATLKEAREGPYWVGFQEAIRQEIKSLEENGTWDVIPRSALPKGANILNCKFVFDIKRGALGEFLKYKARMVAMGFSQKEGVDFKETFASVMKSKSFRILLALWNAIGENSMEHWDVKTAFILEETIYCRPVNGLEPTGATGKILS